MCPLDDDIGVENATKIRTPGSRHSARVGSLPWAPIRRLDGHTSPYAQCLPMKRFAIDPSYPTLLVLFFAGGCAALIYEVVWFEMLRQVVGASSLSIAILLTGYMGGLFLGSLGIARWVSARRHPLRVYAVLEFGIGIFGLLLLSTLPLVRNIYVSAVGYGPTSILLRAIVCLLCLLPPTVMMGATLPVIARWMGASTTGVSRIGLLYAANILGAVAGTLFAGFHLLPLYDLTVATVFAAVLNALAAVVALALAAHFSSETETRPLRSSAYATSGKPHYLVYWVIGLSGFTALSAQVVWTRLASMLFGASVYSFSIILAVFLTGLGLGSAFGAHIVRNRLNSNLALVWTQLGLIVAIPFAALAINHLLPHWNLRNNSFEQLSFNPTFDLLRGSAAMLPATILWGASFPLAVSTAARRESEPGQLVGGIYAANTGGAIIGALACSLLLIPALGTQTAQQLTIVCSGIAAISALALIKSEHRRTSKPRKAAPSYPIAIATFTVFMTLLMPPTEARLIGFGHDTLQWSRDNVFVHVSEGRSASVAVSTSEHSGHRYFHVGGKIVASNMPVDMRLQYMLGQLPALFHPDPKSVLVVGFGAGVTAGSFVHYPGIEKIVICEIEPQVIEAARLHFSSENNGVLDDPRVEIVYDDARHYIATTDQTFDIITSDPLHPWVKGAAALYSVEYFGQVKNRLNAGGIVTQWVPLYQTSEAAVQSQILTFTQSFADTTIWHSNLLEDGYDLVLLGTEEKLRINTGRIQDKLSANPAINRTLNTIGFESLGRLLSSYTAHGRGVQTWLENAEVNHDRSLRLQYLAGAASGRYDAKDIYDSISRNRSFPESLFETAGPLEAELRRLFQDD